MKLFDVPESWCWVPLQVIAEVELGKMLSRKAFEPGLQTLPYLRNQNIRWGHIDFSDLKSMGFKEGELSRYSVRPGDLLICEGGEPGRSAVLRSDRGSLMYQKALHRVRPYGELTSPEYLQYCLWNFATNGLVLPRFSETTIKHLPREKLRKLSIPLPPLREQHRIVAEIEKHFTRLDAAVAALERARANLERYRASVLQAACEGRLVPSEAEQARDEGRSFEPSQSFLSRAIGGFDHAQHEALSTLDELPQGWAWVRLADIAEIQGGLAKGKKRTKGAATRPVPYLRVANVQRGHLDLADIREIDATEDEIQKLRLVQDDVLFTEGGDRDKLGRGWVWSKQIPICIHQNHIFRARLKSRALQPKFISWYGNTLGRRYFEKQGKQTTNLASISLSKLRELPVAIPPKEEQERIVSEVERRLSIVDRLSHEIGTSLDHAARLRQSILKRAFEGRLVSQNPGDEPASVLLERIRAEREDAKSKTEKKRGPKARRQRRAEKPSPTGA